jgi:RNA polymerase sigma-70 factor (ECF subfamily)
VAALNPAPDPVPSLTRSEWSADQFGELVEPFRRELLVHAYRMLGSIDDAEDAVQDALSNAWRGRNTYRRDISLRAWLYRIATNACLDAIQRRKRAAGREDRLGVGPFPDGLLGPAVAGPEARFDARESISLAFLTALQVLPPRQRAVLILRDVLSWHAAEVGALLELSVPAVNSALQRARAGLASGYPSSNAAARRGSADPGQLRSLLDRYVRAWEAADISGLVTLLRDDAVLAMPPEPSVVGGQAIGAFLAATILGGDRHRRLVAIQANGGPAFVVYATDDGRAPSTATPLRALAVSVLEVVEASVVRIDAFFDPHLFRTFGIPIELAG